MLRFVQSDYERFQRYLAEYSLDENLGAKAREELLKRSHKHSLAALQVWAVVDSLGQAGKLKIGNLEMHYDSEHMFQLSEHFSDLTSAVFAGLHGLYKPALMSLRSAIETYIRGIAGLESAEAASTTSVYRLFEISANLAPFSGRASGYFDILRQEYSELCSYVHAATPAHMSRNYALANFPRHDTVQFRNLTRRFERVVTSTLAVLVLANHQLYLQVPVRARDLLDEVVPTPVRLSALGGPVA